MRRLLSTPTPFLLLFLALHAIQHSKALTIECDHEINDWLYTSAIYICNVRSNVSVTHPNTQISRIIDHHTDNKTNADINGFLVAHRTINFFPHALEKFFANLTVIQVQSCDLREIRAEDLRPFAELRALYLPSNSLHLIERDTFSHNRRLEVVWLNQNNIKYIDPNVFDHLRGLQSLNLLGSVHDLGRADNQLEVHKVVTSVKEIFGFASILWADNQELTTELARSHILLEISFVFNLLVLFSVVAVASVKIAKKMRRSNRVHDESKVSTFTELFEFQARFSNANFSE